MNTWFTSDLHFGHRNMVNWRNNRGCNFADADEMNEFIIERYNSVVKPEDTVYLLGDLVMGTIADNLPLLERLNGTKFSTIGNHDRPFDCKPHRYQEWIDKYQEQGVKFVSDFMWCDSFGSFSVSHFPFSGDHTDKVRFLDRRPVDKGQWLVHGHVHEAWQVNGRQINVGVDVWDFEPVSLEQIQYIMANACVCSPPS